MPREFIQVVLKNVNHANVDEVCDVSLGGDRLTRVVKTANGTTAEIEVTASRRIEVTIASKTYWPARVTFEVDRRPSDGYPTLRRTPAASGDTGHHADARTADHFEGGESNGYLLVVTVVVAMLRNASHKVEGMMHRGGNPVELWAPDHPILNRDVSATGWDRLKHTVTPNLTAPGRTYFVERTGGLPRVVAIWVPESLRFNARRGEVPYHLFYTPSIKEPAWGDDELARGTSGWFAKQQNYVHLAFRYLFWEKNLAHQHTHAGKHVPIVIPIGNYRGQLGTFAGRGNVYRLLREVNYFIQRTEGVSYAGWRGQDVGRVALSGFSAGVDWVKSTLDNPEDGDDNARGIAKEFYDRKLREVYNFDGHPDADAFMATVNAWWRGDEDRKFRIYSMKPEFASYARSIDASATPVRFKGAQVDAWEAHDAARSLVVLPEPLLATILTRTNPHQWFPAYFARHASSRGFP
jgi:hypothetical protein